MEFEPNRFSWWLRGYGVRPWHTLAFCILPALTVLGLVNYCLLWKGWLYAFGSGKRRWHAATITFEEAWIRLPPLRYANGGWAKVGIIVSWFVMKVLEGVFVVACSNTSQTLKELIPRLIPG